LSRTGTFDEVSPRPPPEQQTAILARVNAYAHPSITEKAIAWHRLTQEGMALTSWLRANRTDANARTKLENLDEQIVEAFDQVGKAREL
jgi:hypothetical protein